MSQQDKSMKKHSRGVDYYNIDNIDNTNNVDNENNTLNDFCLNETLIQVSPRPHSDAKRNIICLSEQPTPLFEDTIKSGIIQLFDNPKSLQRFKLKIRFNLTDGTNPEFIGSLTQDRRNFTKYIPESHRDQVLYFVDSHRAEIKKHNINPYMGKLHFYDPREKMERNEIQPNTAILVWFNPYEDNKGWSTMIKFQEWEKDFDLFDEYLTPRQRDRGVIGQTSWQNPQHARPRARIWTPGGNNV
jgi:hypothetical protein